MNMTVGTSTSFLLEAYPAPDNFTFTHLYNETSTEGSIVPSTTFSANCTQQAVEQFMVSCEILPPLNTSERLLGFYRVNISNDLGSVEVMLFIGPKDNLKKKIVAGLIFGGLTLFGLITLIVIAIVLKKRRPTSRSNRKRKQPNYFDRVCSPTPSCSTVNEAGGPQSTIKMDAALCSDDGGQVKLQSGGAVEYRPKAYSAYL
ncbi:uncharacterized protein [Littorina saxatilis]|uniref:uncharacterized protein n=1 Tax=Littorina saxatilis TaxID=31220 RepID=UPI0038B4B773